MLKMNHVCAGYHGEDIIHDININFEAGKVTVLIGPNGCGKSTLLKTLVKFIDYKGEIIFDDESLIAFTPSQVAQKIAYLPQGKKAPDISVKRMVLHGRFPYLSYPRKYRKIDYEMVDKAMKWVGIEHLSNKNVSILSGGTQQKVYIAMALAQDTPMIMMDEPTVYLDIEHQIKLMEIAKALAKEGKAVVLVLHDLAQALRYGDEIVVMKDGNVVGRGNAETIYNSKIIEDVFHVTLARIDTENGYQYYYE